MEYGTVDNSLQTADVNAVEVALGTIHILRKESSIKDVGIF